MHPSQVQTLMSFDTKLIQNEIKPQQKKKTNINISINRGPTPGFHSKINTNISTNYKETSEKIKNKNSDKKKIYRNNFIEKPNKAEKEKGHMMTLNSIRNLEDQNMLKENVNVQKNLTAYNQISKNQNQNNSSINSSYFPKNTITSNLNDSNSTYKNQITFTHRNYNDSMMHTINPNLTNNSLYDNGGGNFMMFNKLQNLNSSKLNNNFVSSSLNSNPVRATEISKLNQNKEYSNSKNFNEKSTEINNKTILKNNLSKNPTVIKKLKSTNNFNPQHPAKNNVLNINNFNKTAAINNKPNKSLNKKVNLINLKSSTNPYSNPVLSNNNPSNNDLLKKSTTEENCFMSSNKIINTNNSINNLNLQFCQNEFRNENNLNPAKSDTIQSADNIYFNYRSTYDIPSNHLDSNLNLLSNSKETEVKKVANNHTIDIDKYKSISSENEIKVLKSSKEIINTNLKFDLATNNLIYQPNRLEDINNINRSRSKSILQGSHIVKNLLSGTFIRNHIKHGRSNFNSIDYCRNPNSNVRSSSQRQHQRNPSKDILKSVKSLDNIMKNLSSIENKKNNMTKDFQLENFKNFIKNNKSLSIMGVKERYKELLKNKNIPASFMIKNFKLSVDKGNNFGSSVEKKLETNNSIANKKNSELSNQMLNLNKIKHIFINKNLTNDLVKNSQESIHTASENKPIKSTTTSNNQSIVKNNLQDAQKLKNIIQDLGSKAKQSTIINNININKNKLFSLENINALKSKVVNNLKDTAIIKEEEPESQRKIISDQRVLTEEDDFDDIQSIVKNLRFENVNIYKENIFSQNNFLYNNFEEKFNVEFDSIMLPLFIKR